MRPITDLPQNKALASFSPEFGQRFILTVDTEEEFDWDKPFQRGGHQLDHVERLAKFQQFCENIGVAPIYLIDYPIADSSQAAEILRGPVAAGKAEIGVQLHPWVNPPYDEEVNDFNSFAGNLPKELERAKLIELRDTIARNFDTEPKIYRAGRYGLGPNTGAILREAGIAIDSSIRARFDYSATGGRNYRDHPVEPYWLDREHNLLELPLTTIFSGSLRKQAGWVYPSLWRWPKIRGVFARLGLMERIPLTPEGVTSHEAIHAANVAVADGLPLLVFSFHSPSLRPGNTPYVQSEEDLDNLYDWWRDLFAHLGKKGVRPTTVCEIMDAVVI